MEDKNEDIIAVKAVLDCECKRFGISAKTTFPNFLNTLSGIFSCEISSIQYKDEDDDLVTVGSAEEFLVALKSVPSTGGILRLVLGAGLNQKKCTEPPNDDGATRDSVGASIEDAHRRSAEMLNSMESEKQPEVPEVPEAMEVNPLESSKDLKSSSGESRKSSMRNKIESASQLSKELNFVSSEVTGCIPILPTSSVSGLDTHFTSQKPGARKVRRVSSGTTSGSTDKNEKKQGRGRQTQRKKKRKHRESSSSSSESSTSRSSSLSSSSSSSGSSCEEDYHFYKKSNKKKRKSSPTVKMEKILHKCEKHITAKVAKDMDKYTKKIKEDIVSSVTTSILQKLDGAVLQSYVVPNGVPPQTNEACISPTSSKTGEQVSAKRIRYQHQNVVCDHCESEIFGPRYKCGNCSDYDLCESCESIEGIHTPSHVFVKMHYPAALVGRRSVGGRSRPLLRANIYEEREKEREMEDLLQRKLDSGSELNQKVIEKLEKKRTKMQEVEQAKEAVDKRKEEWKKMKKEIKKNKKELAKKIKQQGKMIQRNMKRGVVLGHQDEGFSFDDHIPKVDPKVVQETIANEDTALIPKTQDDNLSSALSSLQIIQGEVPASTDPATTSDTTDVMYAEISDSNVSASNDAMIDLTTDSDDVVVVDKDSIPPELNPSYNGPEMLQKPDLVDFHKDTSLGVTMSDDFVVLSNYFDLTVPISDKHVHEHRNCDNCRNCVDNFAPDFATPEPCSSSSNELPVDLVASVPLASRSQPDIASVSVSMNIMDQSIENFSTISSSCPISPEPFANKQPDEDDTSQQPPEVIQTCITSQPSNENVIMSEPSNENVVLSEPSKENIIMNEPNPTPTEPILIQPESNPAPTEAILIQPESNPAPTEAISIQPESSKQICVLESVPSPSDNETSEALEIPEPNIDVVASTQHVVASTQQQNIDVVASTQQQTVDFANPIVQSQLAQEQCILNALSPKSFDAARTEICEIREEATQEPSNGNTSNASSVIRTASNDGGLSGALVGAMATIVDTVAQVVQSAKGVPRVAYHNGEVEVTTPRVEATTPRVEAMQKLFDMGFCDRQVNERLLAKHNNDVSACVGDLIAGGNNQWYTTRH